MKEIDKANQQIQDLILFRCPDAPPALYDLIDIVFEELKKQLRGTID